MLSVNNKLNTVNILLAKEQIVGTAYFQQRNYVTRFSIQRQHEIVTQNTILKHGKIISMHFQTQI